MQLRKHVAALLTLFVAIATTGAADAPPRDPRTVRVMSYNIHVGRGVDKKLDLPRIARIIKDADVDVVALQEVDVRARRTDRIDEVAELSRLTGMHGVFGKAKDNDGGDYGQAILSRRAIKDLKVRKLPSDPDQEQRVLLVATIPQERPLPDLIFAGTHLHHTDEPRRLPQAAEVIRVMKDVASKDDLAVILAGDLNSTPDSKVMKQFFETLVDPTADAGFTIPAQKPAHKIDYVLLPKNHNWEVVGAKTLNEPVASDHRPVVVELRWKK
jgi:endonuclease/exonuclease/phosphatase family metal-dependent hydrolase